MSLDFVERFSESFAVFGVSCLFVISRSSVRIRRVAPRTPYKGLILRVTEQRPFAPPVGIYVEYTSGRLTPIFDLADRCEAEAAALISGVAQG